MVNLERVNDPNFAKNVLEGSRQALVENDFGGAVELFRALKGLEEPGVNVKPELVSLYEEAKRNLFFVAFPLLTEGEILDFLPKFLPYLNEYTNFNFLRQVQLKLRGIGDLGEREDFRKRLRNFLLNSEVLLTQKPIVTQEGVQIPGKIKEWLKNYLEFLGGKKADALKRAEFLSSPLTRLLSDKDKVNLQEFLKCFDYLSLSSADLEAVSEEENILFSVGPAVIAVTGGDVQVIEYDKIKQIDLVRNIYQALEAAALASISEESQIEKEASSYLKENPLTEEKIKEIFKTLFTQGKTESKEVLASLIYLFQEQKISQFLNLIRTEFIQLLKERKDLSQEVLDIRLKGLEKGTPPEALKQFLKFVLIDCLQFNENYAAAIASRLIGRLKDEEQKKFFGLAYYDMQKKLFVWES